MNLIRLTPTKMKKAYTQKLDEDLKADLKKIADKNHRSLSNMIEVILMEYVAQNK